MRIIAALGLVVLVGCASPAVAEDEGSTTSHLGELPACLPLDVCEPPKWSFEKGAWKHKVHSEITTHLGTPLHRGRDMFFVPGEKQTVHAKFTYGLIDKDLKNEDVDVFVQRDCGSEWEKLGTARSTADGDHLTRDGVVDNGGRIYFDVPAGKELGLGRHRVRSVVVGDGTFVDSFIDVVPPGTPFILSDVDGTLTSSEAVEVLDIVTSQTADAHPGAAQAFTALAQKGYRVIYLTSRPEFDTERTREFVQKRGFPPGLVQTSSSSTGAGMGDSASKFKTEQLALLKAKGLIPAFAFGNRTSDSDAYKTVAIPKQHRIFFQLDGAFEGRNIRSYEDLVPEFQKEDAVCK